MIAVPVLGLNHRRRLATWTLVVEDALQLDGSPPGERQRVRLILPHVPARGSCSTSYRAVLTRRGRYRFGPLHVYSRFPFGLARSGMVLQDCPTLLVGPRLGQLTQCWLQLVDSRLHGSHSEGRLQGMLEGDYYGLREWRPGDVVTSLVW